MLFFSFLSCICLVTIQTTFGSSLTQNFNTRIIGGQDAEPGDSPWQAAIFVENNKTTCSGALINSEWVVSVAHCLYGLENFDTTKIGLGTLQLSQGGIVKNIKKVEIHPGYKDPTLANNIALIQLDTPVTLSSEIEPIALVSGPLGSDPKFTVSGWGSISETSNDYYDKLQKLETTQMDWDQCKSTFGPNFPLGEECMCFQISGGGKNPCWNDAGAPLVIQQAGEPKLLGFLSFVSSMGCNTDWPTVFTTVNRYKNWITSITNPIKYIPIL